LDIVWTKSRGLQVRVRVSLLLTAALAVVISGVGTIAISRSVSDRQTQDALLRSAQTLGYLLKNAGIGSTNKILHASRLSGVRLVTLTAHGLAGALPPRMTLKALNLSTLRAAKYQMGHVNGVAFVAYPITLRGKLSALILTHALPSIAEPAIFVILAGALTTLVAVSIADLYTRRIAESLRALVTRAHRIAAGDLTESKRSNRPLELEIQELTDAIDEMVKSLRDATASESQFLMSISHDLRTPLTSIRGFSEAIIDHAIDDPEDAAATILREASRIEHLVEDLMSLARLRSRDFTIHPQRVSLRDILGHLGETMGFRATAAEVTLSTSFPPTDIMLTIDPERLLQLVTNLLDNAIKYARREVHLVVRVHPEAIVIEVRDDGPGIPAHRRPSLFAHQVAPTPGRNGTIGSGLGLLIVSQLARNMNLDLGIRSPLHSEGGTAVYLRIPSDITQPTPATPPSTLGTPLVE